MNTYTLIILILSIPVFGLISATGIFLSQKFKSFETLTSSQAIIIFFIISLIAQIILSGQMLMSARIGSIIGGIIAIILMGLLGNLFFRLINYFLKNNYDQTLKKTFSSSLFFPIIVEFLPSLRILLNA